jgi:putative membrane protein insertion efficiency factor
MNVLRRAATLPLRIYRRWISPLKPPMCRFSPTCSQYAVEAIERHGILRGGAYATWRLLRCQPFAKGGYDPVPGTEDSSCRDDTPRARGAGARKHDGACEHALETTTSPVDTSAR